MKPALKISERLHYAFLTMTALAVAYEQGEWLALSAVAKQFKLSQGYLEEMVVALRSAGLVQSRRGSGGGYQLTKSPHAIKLIEIVMALEGPLEVVDCQGCFMHTNCFTEPVWQGLETVVLDYFKKQTLAEVVVLSSHEK